MTDQHASDTTASAGKRERLVGAACQLFYEHGVDRTTLADIAVAADVPLGNVYYYFKTKDDIIAAVVETQVGFIEQTIASFERHRSPAARLKALVNTLSGQADTIALYGCPHGSLCTELHKRSQPDPQLSGRLVQLPLQWVEQQFAEMGRRDAKDLAVDLIASYQGTTVLTQALGQPELMARQARKLNRWIDTLAANPGA